MISGTAGRLGPYAIVEPLGAGGMGEVYRATDTRLGRTVAIKMLWPNLAAHPDQRARFEREARAVSSLNHPHICTLYDVGETPDTQFLDFGLAKPTPPVAAAEGDAATRIAPVTTQGTILGTIEYMSPEQVEGRE